MSLFTSPVAPADVPAISAQDDEIFTFGGGGEYFFKFYLLYLFFFVILQRKLKNNLL
jgi:hypothetical protein